MDSFRNSQKILFGLGVAYLIFVDYGSLIPLEFSSCAAPDIYAFYFSHWNIEKSISFTDRITNILLSVPLAFFLYGYFTKSGNRLWNSATAFLVILFCLFDAALVEYLQCYLPTRTPTLEDIWAQGLGASIGIALWISFGDAFLLLLNKLAIKPSGLSRRIYPLPLGITVWVIFYFVGLCLLNGYFTSQWLSMQDAFAKIADIHFAPFYGHYFATTAWATFSVFQYFSMYAPVGIFFWLRPTYSESDNFWTPVFISVCLAFVIESGKLFLEAKYPDSTNIFLAACASGTAFTICSRWHWSSISDLKQTQTENIAPTTLSYPFIFNFQRILSVGIFLLIGFFLLNFPINFFWLASLIGIYSFILVRFPAVWLLVLPLLLPVMDFTPWTGRFFLNEFDLVVFSTIAVYLWIIPHYSWELQIPKRAIGVFLLFMLSCFISMLVGLLPLPDIDFNAFSTYYSRYNSLLAIKGFLEVAGLLPLLIYNIRSGIDVLRHLCSGMVMGLTGAVIAGVWERIMFPGLFNFSSTFRISALFSSMHTGDSPVEAYLVSALPFLLGWIGFAKTKLRVLVALIIFIPGVYALFVTFARGGYGAFIVSILILTAGGYYTTRYNRNSRTHFFLATALLALIVGLVTVPILYGSFAKSRLAVIGEDKNIRLNHWHNALAMMDSDWATQFWGMGLGRFPETYFLRDITGSVSATYQIQNENDNPYLRLGSGDVIYLEQILSVKPNETYQLSFDTRSANALAGLNIMICQRTFFESYNCQDFNNLKNVSSEWAHNLATINSKSLGEGPWFARRTVKLILENIAEKTVIDVDNIKLIDSSGNNLVENGDFTNGLDYWYFSAGNHLAWHVKNIFVLLVFEQGWLGLGAFLLLITITLSRILATGLQGKMIAFVVLSSLVGFLCVGLVGSPLDAPRINFLFYLLLACGYLTSLSTAPLSVLRGARSKPHSSSQDRTYRERMESDAAFVYKEFKRPTDSANQTLKKAADLKSSPDKAVELTFKSFIPLIAGIVVMTVGAFITLHLPFMPYNIRELLNDAHPFLGLLGLVMLLFWTFGFPLLIAFWLSSSGFKVWHYPLLLICHGIFAWLLVSVSVSLESIHDIVGSPVLNWGWRWEIAGRFIALFSAYSLLSTVVALIILPTVYQKKVISGWVSLSLTALFVYPLIYHVVVTEAATDNLVELMAGGGTVFSAFVILLFMGLLVACGSWVAAQISLHKSISLKGLICLISSFPMGYLLINQGTEQVILKYDTVFSALQFLLSTDRQHYIQGNELLFRYFVLHAGVVGLIIFVQAFVFRVLKDFYQTEVSSLATKPKNN